MRPGISVVLLALLTGCVAPTEPSVAFRQVRPAGLPIQDFACQTRLRVVSGAAELSALTSGIEFSEPPAVDFTREMAVVLSLGSRPSAGFDLDVRGVRKHGSDLVIDAVEMPPGTCVTLGVVTCPWTMVIVPKAASAEANWTIVPRRCA
jgi:hypothetical protein